MLNGNSVICADEVFYHKRSMNVPQAAKNAIKVRALSYARILEPKVGRRRALSAVIELLLCWLVSRTYRLYCSGSKVALGLSLRARMALDC